MELVYLQVYVYVGFIYLVGIYISRVKSQSWRATCTFSLFLNLWWIRHENNLRVHPWMNRQCGMLKLRIVGNGGQNVYSVSYGPSFWSTEFPNFSSRYQIFSFIIISVYACRNKLILKRPWKCKWNRIAK